MDNRRAVIRARYYTPIGHTVKTLDKPKALKKGISEMPTKPKRLAATKAQAIVQWFDELRTSKIQLAAYKAGIECREFADWEFTYIPNMFREATRIIKSNKYLCLRLEALDKDIPLNQYYKQKGIKPNIARYREEKEANIVFWALEYFEKQYGGAL